MQGDTTETIYLNTLLIIHDVISISSPFQDYKMFSIVEHCILQFNLTHALLTHFCELTSAKENLTVTDIPQLFIINACCPSILNQTTSSTRSTIDKYNMMCQHLRLTEDHPTECDYYGGEQKTARNSRLEFMFDWFQFTYLSLIHI